MKFRQVLLFVAISQIGLSPLYAQEQGTNGQVTEFTHSISDLSQSAQGAIPTKNTAEFGTPSENTLKEEQSRPSAVNLSSTRAAAENTNLPGTEANVSLTNQQYLPTGPTDTREVNNYQLSETAKANTQPLTHFQLRAKKRLAKANAHAAAAQAQTDASKASAHVPNNSVYNTSKFSMYAQFGIQDHKLGGLNLLLESDYYPAAGSYSYLAEIGTLYRISEENTFDIGLSYELMDGLEKNQRLNRPSTGQIANSQSTMWLVGFQAGLDHNLLHDSEWSVAIGLGAGADYGGLHLTERIEEIVTTLPVDPSIPTPDEVSVVHYNTLNVRVTPRLTFRSPMVGNGWQIQARVGYQFGKNTMFRVDEMSSIKNELIFNPTGLNASVGFVAPLPRLFCR